MQSAKITFQLPIDYQDAVKMVRDKSNDLGTKLFPKCNLEYQFKLIGISVGFCMQTERVLMNAELTCDRDNASYFIGRLLKYAEVKTITLVVVG
jgi:hypothetical protein